jgi:colanic acid biosynthesis glycosyl transferase WcaI
LKILFILGFANPFAGAAWTRIGLFAESWVNKSNSVDVLGTVTYKTVYKRGSEKLGEVNIYNIIPHMVSSHPFAFAIDGVISFIITTLFLLAKKPNVALMSMPTGDVGLGAIFACRLTRTKYVVEYRDEWEQYEINRSTSKAVKKAYKFIKTLMSKLLHKSAFVVTVTSSFAQNLALRGAGNVQIVPNGADVTIFKPGDKKALRQKLGFDINEFIIVYTGIIGDYYHLDIVAKALSKLESDLRDKTKLLLIGDGPDLPKIMKIAKNHGLEKNIQYLGIKKDKKDLADILAASDVGVVPGLYTKGQLPVKFFEYSACGIPTIAIAPDDSLLAELIREEQIGITLQSMSENELAQVISEIYKKESFRFAAGKRAKVLIEEKFDRNKLAENYLKKISDYASSQ